MYHLDLKLENCLLDKGGLRLCDFGMATREPVSNRPVGTEPYKAPEVLAGFEYTCSQVDLFSAGVVFFTLLTGNRPFGRADKTDFFYR